jgi:hypothetical protein
MKLALILILVLASPAIALDLDWNGDPEPEPEPPVVTLTAPIRTGSDRDPVSTPTVYPCCIKDGAVVVLRRDMFSSEARTKRRCKRALKRSDAVILECPGVVSPEAMK